MQGDVQIPFSGALVVYKRIFHTQHISCISAHMNIYFPSKVLCRTLQQKVLPILEAKNNLDEPFFFSFHPGSVDRNLIRRRLLAPITLFTLYQQMQNRMAVFLCNLRPVKMRGIVSQAMVMCASTPDKVEILDPPSGAQPGERVTFQGFPGAK